MDQCASIAAAQLLGALGARAAPLCDSRDSALMMQALPADSKSKQSAEPSPMKWPHDNQIDAHGQSMGIMTHDH